MENRGGSRSWDEWEYRIFRFVLFLIFLSIAYQVLDSHLHISSFLLKFFAMFR